MIWIILAILLMGCALWMCIKPYIPSCLPAYAAFWILKASGAVSAPSALMLSWGIVVIVLLIIDYIQPQAVAKATNGTLFFTVGALAGVAVGMNFMSQTGILVGAGAGLIFGAFAFSRSASGKALGFPSVRFFQYLCAKGFPIIVTISIIGIAALLWIMRHYPEFALENM